MLIIFIAFAAFVSTILGGLLALRFKDKLHLILGFSAGAIIAVAFFDLMPEALELAGESYDTNTIMLFVALGFLGYLVLDRTVFHHFHTHSHEHDHEHGHDHSHDHAHMPESQTNSRGILGAASLCLHSFLDGVAIGLAFQVSNSVGVIVTAAVLTHDFSDGINTVGLILKNKGSRKQAFRWLGIDALAPVAGVISTMFFTLSEASLGIVLALFSGFFLYLGASDLVPESYHAHPKFLTTAMTVIGAAVLYAAIKLAGV